MKRQKNQKNACRTFHWILLLLLILMFFLTNAGMKAQADDFRAENQIDVKNKITFAPQGSTIPKPQIEAPSHVYGPSAPPPVQLIPLTSWNEDKPQKIITKKSTWTIDELKQIANPKKFKFEEFNLWGKGIKETEVKMAKEPKKVKIEKKIKIIIPDKQTLALIPRYQVIGYAVVTGYATALKIILNTAKRFAENGADGIIIDACGSEKEQDSDGYALGLGTVGGIINGVRAANVVLGGVYHREHLEYNTKRYIQATAIKFLETEKEAANRIAKEETIRAAKTVAKKQLSQIEKRKKIIAIPLAILPSENIPPEITIYFDLNSYKIPLKELPKIKTMVSWLAKHPNCKVQVEGHCSAPGTRDYNFSLGGKRALAVTMKVIDKFGLPREQLMPNLILQYVSAGEERPAFENAAAKEEHDLNQRVVFRIVGPASGQ